MEKEYTKCPFCGEDNFDLVGLKYHLLNYCGVYKETFTVEEERQLREMKERR